jgi:hypothetical protein
MEGLHNFDRVVDQAGRLSRDAWVLVLILIKSRRDERIAQNGLPHC